MHQPGPPTCPDLSLAGPALCRAASKHNCFCHASGLKCTGWPTGSSIHRPEAAAYTGPARTAHGAALNASLLWRWSVLVLLRSFLSYLDSITGLLCTWNPSLQRACNAAAPPTWMRAAP